MKQTLLISALFLALTVNSQTKIASNTFLYGELKNNINDKILVWYGIDDSKGELQAIESFQKNGLNVINYNSLFLPGQEYSNEEKANIFKSNNIQTMILIKHTNTSTSGISFANSNYNTMTKSVNTTSSSAVVIDNVYLEFEIYSSNNEFKKPIAIIKAHATNNWGVAGTQSGLIKTILKNVINGIKNYK